MKIIVNQNNAVSALIYEEIAVFLVDHKIIFSVESLILSEEKSVELIVPRSSFVRVSLS